MTVVVRTDVLDLGIARGRGRAEPSLRDGVGHVAVAVLENGSLGNGRERPLHVRRLLVVVARRHADRAERESGRVGMAVVREFGRLAVRCRGGHGVHVLDTFNLGASANTILKHVGSTVSNRIAQGVMLT